MCNKAKELWVYCQEEWQNSLDSLKKKKKVIICILPSCVELRLLLMGAI